MPVLLLPAGLAALAALGIPLLLHLARRDALRPVDFAALRWLAAQRRPRAEWRIDEWPLLLVRLLLLALVALWLARPALTGGAAPTPWVAVVPGAKVAPSAGQHWLAPGFPPRDRPAPSGPLPVASLLRELDAALPARAPLTVVVPEAIDGADAERPRLSRAVTWRIVPGTMPAAAERADPVPRLTVRYALDRAAAVRYLRAAAIAWAAPGHAPAIDAAPAGTPLPADPRILVWLSPAPLPAAAAAWVARGGTALVEAAPPAAANAVWHDATGATLAAAAPVGGGRRLWVRRLDPASLPQLLDADFPVHLRALLAPPRPPPVRIAAADLAPVTGAAAYPAPARDLQPWLALLVAALFLIERTLATARRGTTP